jgi:hypothetical protein
VLEHVAEVAEKCGFCGKLVKTEDCESLNIKISDYLERIKRRFPAGCVLLFGSDDD